MIALHAGSWLKVSSKLLLSLAVLTIVLVSAGQSFAQSDGEEAQAPAVTVAFAERRDFQNASSFSGRVEAIDSVDLIARVQGYLKNRYFDEGTLVNEGDLLFELDQATYRNALNQAQAALQVAESNVRLAKQKFERQTELTERNVQSVALLEEAQANLDVSSANVLAARAKVEAAQINLDYTRIEAPFTGFIGRSNVSKGDLISPQSGPMASVVKVDPIYVSFPIPQGLLISLKRGDVKNDDVRVALSLADGTPYAHQGKVIFSDVSATSSTDSVIVRAVVPNPENILINQGLVDVKVVANEDSTVLAIPLQALLLDQQGAYVLVVDQEDIVRVARIEEGEQQDGYISVESGLEEGARVIISGVQKARPGSKVAPSANQPKN